MTTPLNHFLAERRKTLVRLAVYFAFLGAIGYGSVMLLSAGLVSAFATNDRDLEWMRPGFVATPAPERMHPSLKPKLRGSIED